MSEEKYNPKEKIQKLIDENKIIFHTEENDFNDFCDKGLGGLVHNDILKFLDEKKENGDYIRKITDGKSVFRFKIKYEGGEEPEEEIIEKKEDKKKSKKQKKILENYIHELWKDEHGNSYATIILKDHKENWAIYSRNFRNFVTKIIYEELKEIPDSRQVKTLQDIFAAIAQFEGKKHDTFLRCAKLNDSIYIDLCRDDWKVLKITKEKIEEIDSDIKFKRFNHMQELKYDGNANKEDIELIFKYANIQNPKDRLLYKVDLPLTAIADIPRAIDNLHGSPGSGKTITFKYKRKIIDPSSMETLSLSKDKTELVQKLSHHYICNFDNVRRINQEFSDIFCRVTTGDAFSKRELYTDDEDIIYKIKRKLGFDGINIVGEEPDFLDRGITYELSRIPKKERRKEADILKSFEKDQPKITGAVFKILQDALTKKESIKLDELPRMADYCFWGEAISQVLGEDEKKFTGIYFEKIGSLSKEALETNPVGLCLLEFMKETTSYEGTASNLLEKLTFLAEKLKINTKHYFPKAPHALTRRINEIKANLEEEGIILEYDTTGKQRIIRIYPKKSVESVGSVEEMELNPEKPKFDGIGGDAISDAISEEGNNSVDSSTLSTVKDAISEKRVNEGIKSNVNAFNGKNAIIPDKIEIIKVKRGLDKFTEEELNRAAPEFKEYLKKQQEETQSDN